MIFAERMRNLIARAQASGVEVCLVHLSSRCAGKLNCICARLDNTWDWGWMSPQRLAPLLRNKEVGHKEGIHYFVTEKGVLLYHHRIHRAELRRELTGGNFRNRS